MAELLEGPQGDLAKHMVENPKLLLLDIIIFNSLLCRNFMGIQK